MFLRTQKPVTSSSRGYAQGLPATSGKTAFASSLHHVLAGQPHPDPLFCGSISPNAGDDHYGIAPSLRFAGSASVMEHPCDWLPKSHIRI